MVCVAIYHFSVKIIGRSSGRSSVAASAYRVGEKILNRFDGRQHDYSRRKGVVYKEILLPTEAPIEFYDRATLWNAVEFSEKRKDAQTAREVEVALPCELDLQENIALLREYIDKNFIDLGVCADFAMHNNDGNPHAHIMLTMREVSERGFGKKNRDWNKPQMLEKWREGWARCVNERLKLHGFSEFIDHRSLEAQGSGREATIHIGYGRGKKAREVKNLDIINRNRAKCQRKLQDLTREICTLNAELIVKKQEIHNLERKIEAFEEHMKNIDGINAEIRALGYSWRTKERIAALEKRREQAELYLLRRFGAALDHAHMELWALKNQVRELSQSVNNPHLTELLRERDRINKELGQLPRQKERARVADREHSISRERSR